LREAAHGRSFVVWVSGVGVMAEHVGLCEVGPRDGLQMAKTRMATPAKLRWIAALAASGLREIEVGSFVPARVIPQMVDTQEVVEDAVRIHGLTVQALAPNLRGAQGAYNAGAHRISIPVSVSEGHSRANLNRTPAEQVEEVARMVAWVRAQSRPMPVIAARCPPPPWSRWPRGWPRPARTA
jgi:hydroxymethylglutaryl-CoA lyase